MEGSLHIPFNKMKITVKEIKSQDLKPGDLFSAAGELYWKAVERNDKRSIGEKVYIRTDEACPEDQNDVLINLIKIEND